MIAVTGATGEVGRRVAVALAEQGVEQRLVVRDPDRAPVVGAQIAVCDSYAEGDQLREAFAGADTVFLVSGRETPDRLEQHFNAVNAATAAGVRRIVYTSFVNPRPDATFTLVRQHHATEEHIRTSGMAFTFLRDNLYQDMLPLFTGADGALRGPAGEGRAGAVARDDVADVAVAVLTGEGHEDQAYDVTGPAALSLAEAAEALSAVTGREISYVEETVEDAFASRSGYGAPAWEVEGWVSTYVAIAKGELDVVSDTVSRLTGHEPLSFSEWLERHPESWQHLAA